eukprot:6212717-Pleurochrysis_carterae.AAC.2
MSIIGQTNALVLRGRGSEERISPSECCAPATYVRGIDHLREHARYPPPSPYNPPAPKHLFKAFLPARTFGFFLLRDTPDFWALPT